MSEEIVACPGCGKKFRIPDGAPPGSFACTACGADVVYGAASPPARPARGGAAGGRAGRGKGGRGGRGKGAGAAKAATGGSRGARRARGRRAREDAEAVEDDGRGGRRRGQAPEKENKTAPLIIAIMGIVLLIGILIIAFTSDPPDHSTDVATTPSVDTTAGSITSSNGETPVPGSTGDDGAAPTPTPTTTPTPVPTPVPEDPSGIGGSEGGEVLPKDYRWWSHRDDDLLFEKCTPFESTTDAEAEEFENLVTTFLDMSSGGDGMRAGRSLEKAGIKGFPHLMNGFVRQYNADKWTTEEEKWASWQCQQVARRMIKATPGPPSLEARFSPGVDVEPDRFYRAARMWLAWWKGVGSYRTEFEKYEDEE